MYLFTYKLSSECVNKNTHRSSNIHNANLSPLIETTNTFIGFSNTYQVIAVCGYYYGSMELTENLKLIQTNMIWK